MTVHILRTAETIRPQFSANAIIHRSFLLAYPGAKIHFMKVYAAFVIVVVVDADGYLVAAHDVTFAVACISLVSVVAATVTTVANDCFC